MNPNLSRNVALLLAVAAGILAFVLRPDSPAALAQPPWAAIAAGAAAIVAVLLALQGGAPAADTGAMVDAIRRARRGDRVSAPAGTTPDVQRVFDELARISDEEERRVRDQKEASQQLETLSKKLQDGIAAQLGAADETSRLIKEMAGAMRDFA